MMRRLLFAACLAVVIGAAHLLLPAHMAGAGEPSRDSPDCLCPQDRKPPAPAPRQADARPMLDGLDEIAALQAVLVGLTEAADGATFVWKRGHGRLGGSVRPTSSFRDAEGRVCRHLVVTLSSGAYSRTAEGVACRQHDGRWALEG